MRVGRGWGGGGVTNESALVNNTVKEYVSDLSDFTEVTGVL
jgi:hypothetical protein